MTTLKDLISQRAELDQKITEYRKAEQADAIARAVAIVQEFQLVQEDIFGTRRRSTKVKSDAVKIPAKFRDPVSGKEWSGRGISPRWLVGKNKEEFLISQASAS